MNSLPEALLPLQSYNQFMVYKLVPDKKRPGKTIKYPCSINGNIVDPHDSQYWVTAEIAIKTTQQNNVVQGVAFVFTDQDPFFFVDIDDCLTPENQWSSDAQYLMNALPGAAVEISQSGRGLHIFGRGKCPEHGVKSKTIAADLFTEKRFVALTGNSVVGSANVDLTTQLTALAAEHFPVRVAAEPENWTTTADARCTAPDDDKKLIAIALKSKSTSSAFGDTASFSQLWNADVDALTVVYDSQDGVRPYDYSSADMALAQHLAFYTGKNCERILRLMWLSKLVRDKWTKHNSYLQRTILRAVSLQGDMVYTGGKPKPVTIETATAPLGNTDGPEVLVGYQYLGITQQIEHFKGCVYVLDQHRVFVPRGMLLKSDQFNAMYGGYIFQLDTGEAGKTTKKAWEAFTESQAVRYPKAESTCFRPMMNTGDLIEENGRIVVNTYVPIDIPCKKGDPAPFLLHLKKLLPDENDQAILLAYMAACIQYKGVKFQWCPLLQGVEGNGKTLFTRCVSFAIGKRYTHYPKAANIDSEFNSWLLNKLLIGIEDIYVPAHRKEIIDTLKPMITGGDGLEIQLKGVDQVTADICCNFIINSNHKNAIQSHRNDRRFAMFFTAQQTADDLERDGMGGDYFPNLYTWLKDGGYAIVYNYLSTYAIPDALNPGTFASHRAPKTSSTDAAITASLGSVEQELIEAIDEGRQGFAGGWVSSKAFDRMLSNMGMARSINHAKRGEMLQMLGYKLHPGLNKGRVNNNIMIDGGKPRLYVKDGHLSINYTNPSDISQAYQDAQNGMNDAAIAFGNSK